MKVSELEGALLDYWVARADGELAIFEGGVCKYHYDDEHGTWDSSWRPSTDWAIGGPLIERHRIAVSPFEDGFAAMLWDNNGRGSDYIDAYVYEWDQQGPTPLIAAMRALVVSKFGEELPESA